VLKAVKVTGQASIFRHAENFLSDIKNSRVTEIEENRPIIFVGHCLRGMAIKEAMIGISEYYQNKQHGALGSIYFSTNGVVRNLKW
jgi:hypothetical protein